METSCESHLVETLPLLGVGRCLQVRESLDLGVLGASHGRSEYLSLTLSVRYVYVLRRVMIRVKMIEANANNGIQQIISTSHGSAGGLECPDVWKVHEHWGVAVR